MARKHYYRVDVRWIGNTGRGTSGYKDYERAFEASCQGKAAIAGSSDPAFRGDPSRWNPEELFVASISSCHKLWYLHLCAEAGIIVLAYVDVAEGVMEESADGSGRFIEVMLRPLVTVAEGSDRTKATLLHEAAHAKCFIANSVNFTVSCVPSVS